jgi:histidyl-tRNA synthetase
MDKLNTAIANVAQIISDRKFVLSHIDHVEKLNLELESKNSALNKSVRILNTMVNKNKIVPVKKKTEKKLDVFDENKDLLEQLEQFVKDDLDELRELHNEIDSAIIAGLQSKNEIKIEIIIDGFAKYSSIISFYTFFEELGHVLSAFSNTMKNNKFPEDEKTIENILMLLESFMFVL